MAEWKKVQFKDLYYKISEKNNLSFGKDKIISVANMYYNSNAKITDDEYLRTYNIFRVGDIAFEGNKSKNFANGRFVENTIGDGIISHVFDVFRPLTDLNLLYWKYVINNENIMGRILKRCTKSATMMNNLVADDFLKEFISVPPIEEQQEIAEILSTQDKVIELKQKLIDQKKQQKKYLMQNLLTGRIRIDGFSGKWEKVRLGDYIVECTEKTTINNQYPVLTSSRKGIMLQTDYYNRQVASEDNTGYNVVPFGYFTYRHMSDDEIFRFNINTIVEKGIVSTLYPVFTTKNLIDNWLLYTLNYGFEFPKYARIQKQGGSRTYMYLEKLKKIKLAFPPIEEQTAIAEILSAQDKEIELLEKQLEQEKLKKKALMQLLLTGKIRVA